MLAKCANPFCDQAFRYLRDGKLFLLERPRHARKAEKNGTAGRKQDLEYFWLCARCSAAMIVVVNERGDVVVSGVPGTRSSLVLRAVV